MQHIPIDDAIKRVVAKCGLPEETVRTVLQAQAEVAWKSAPEGFPIPGIGVLVLLRYEPRAGRNPVTGKLIRIPTKILLKCRVAQIAKRSVITGPPEVANVLTDELLEEDLSNDG